MTSCKEWPRELWCEEHRQHWARCVSEERDLYKAIVQAAVGVRKHGSDYKDGTHARILWNLVDKEVASLFPKSTTQEGK